METTEQVLTEDQAMDALDDVSEEIETEEAEAPVEEQPEADEDEIEEEGDTEEDSDAEEDDEGDEDDAPDTYTVKVDGQDVEVTLEDLKRSFSGQKFIQKGMEENAQARKVLEQQFHDIQSQREQLAQFAQTIQERGVIPEPQAPDPRMAHTDPIGYMQERADYEARLGEYQQQQAQIQQQVAQHQQMTQQQRMQRLEAEKAKLLQAIPEFGDPQKAAQMRDEIVAVAAEYGFGPEELSTLSDARTIIALRDLVQFRSVKQSKRKVAEKVAQARPVAKPGTANKSSGRAKKRKDLMSKLRETGSDEYALRLLEE